MISLGMAIASFVPLVLFWIFGEHHLRAVWRISLGLGFVPAFFVFLWRLNMDEPMHYKKHSMKRIRIPYWLAVKRYWVPLFGISLTWFIFDFIIYPFHIYSSSIINNITGGNQSLTVVLGWSCVIGVFSLPGNVIGAYVCDWIGPRNTMAVGLLFQAIIGFIMSGLFEPLSRNVGAFAVVYGIFLSFASLGPGNCTIILAAKAGPTAVRGQFYAIAAALGKIGALVGTLAFPPIIDAFGGPQSTRGNTGPFWISSGLCVLSIGILMATVGELTHDGMIEEDIKFREYLVANGFDVSMMGIGSETSTRVADEDEKYGSSEDDKVAA
jgi:MFS family permease